MLGDDHEMVEQLDIDQGEGILELPGQQLVGAARLRDAGGVIVGEDHRGGVGRERGLHHLTRIDARLRQRSAKQLLDCEHPVLRTEHEGDEDFVLAAAEREPQVIAHRARGRERVASWEVAA